jgi:hypothetical protein
MERGSKRFPSPLLCVHFAIHKITDSLRQHGTLSVYLFSPRRAKKDTQGIEMTSKQKS